MSQDPATHDYASAADKVSPFPARLSYVQHGEVIQDIRNVHISGRGDSPQ